MNTTLDIASWIFATVIITELVFHYLTGEWVYLKAISAAKRKSP